MKTNDDAFYAIVTILIVLAAILALPIAQIWAINTLFGTSITYSIKNFLAVMILNTAVRFASSRKTTK